MGLALEAVSVCITLRFNAKTRELYGLDYKAHPRICDPGEDWLPVASLF